MTFKEFTRAIAYHTQEDRLGSYFKSIVSSIALVVCFVYALGQTVGSFTKKMIYVTYKVFTTITEAYRSLTAMISSLLDAYHSIPVYSLEKEQLATQVSEG